MKTKRLLALVLAVIMVFSLMPLTANAASCATGDHAIVVIPAKAPSYTEMGWNEYELCEYCEYSIFYYTFNGIFVTLKFNVICA